VINHRKTFSPQHEMHSLMTNSRAALPALDYASNFRRLPLERINTFALLAPFFSMHHRQTNCPTQVGSTGTMQGISCIYIVKKPHLIIAAVFHCLATTMSLQAPNVSIIRPSCMRCPTPCSTCRKSWQSEANCRQDCSTTRANICCL
jgi:hypothetical protein